jgi:hypothetical protein
MLIFILKVVILSSLLVYRLVHTPVIPYIPYGLPMMRESWVRLADREVHKYARKFILACGCIPQISSFL